MPSGNSVAASSWNHQKAKLVYPTPDIEWYISVSERRNLSPRCPFSSVYRCPRFYQSLSILGNAGSTHINPRDDKRLLRRWKRSDLWPVKQEQMTAIAGAIPNRPTHFWNFCPEVMFEHFGLFASDLNRYSDDIDIGLAHSELSRQHAPSNDWRWQWSHIVPMHYSECPLFSPLLAATSDGSNNGDIFELKPNWFGIGINIKALFRCIWSRILKR